MAAKHTATQQQERYAPHVHLQADLLFVQRLEFVCAVSVQLHVRVDIQIAIGTRAREASLCISQ
jgi:hypothetical protein